MKRTGTTRDRGTTQHAPHPRHSIGPQSKQQGGRQHANGGHRHSTGRPATQPPFTHHATHHPLCHPPSTTAPPPTTTRGEQTEDTPPHEHHRHTHRTRTPQHLARNTVRHDSSTRQHCSGMSRARVTPLYWAGQQQYTPPPFHIPRRMDTIHSSTHHSHTVHVHTTDDQR